MTLTQVNEILEGTFSNPTDRIYWENKRKELLIKEAANKNNEEYFKAMAVYNR